MATKHLNIILREQIEREWTSLLTNYPEIFKVDNIPLECLFSNKKDVRKCKVSFSKISSELCGSNIREIETKTWDGIIYNQLIISL
jgi:hypothetical protein